MSKDKNLCQNRTYHSPIRYVYGQIHNFNRIAPMYVPMSRDKFLCQKNGTFVNEQVFMPKHEYLCQARVPMSKDELIYVKLMVPMSKHTSTYVKGKFLFLKNGTTSTFVKHETCDDV